MDNIENETGGRIKMVWPTRSVDEWTDNRGDRHIALPIVPDSVKGGGVLMEVQSNSARVWFMTVRYSA